MERDIRRTFGTLLAGAALAAGCGGPDAGPPPTGGLAIDSTVPVAAADSASFSQALVVYFDRDLDAATVTGNNVGALYPGGATVQGNVSYDAAARAIKIDLPLMPRASYRGIVTTGVRGTGGESLDDDYIWNFTTRETERTVIDASGEATVPVIALDGTGGIHAAFVDTTSGAVRYAYCASGCAAASNWGVATVGAGAGAGSRIDIVVSAAGAPSVAYYAAAPGALVVTSCSAGCTSAGGWTAATVDDAAGDVGYSPSMARTNDGAINVIYRDHGTGKIRFSRCVAGCTSAAAWTTPVVIDAGDDRGRVSDLTVAASGTLFGIWTADSDDFGVFAQCLSNCAVAASWTLLEMTVTAGVTQTVQVTTNAADRPVISLGSEDFVAVGFCITATCLDQASWTFLSLLQDALPGTTLSLDIDPRDRIHLSYATGLGAVRYISCNRICDVASQLWAGGSLDTGSDAVDVAVAATPAGEPHAVARLVTGQLVFIR
ncbi:MAG: Ig-like domain-containing protein [Gemmatimonadales bacterium]